MSEVKPSAARRRQPLSSARQESTLGVLVASHSHPDVQHGGSEVASHALFTQLQAQPTLKSWYLGCTRGDAYARTGQTITQPFRPDDYLYTVGEFDWFRFANRDMAFARDFRAMLRNLQPEIVHFHHYLNFGVEALHYVAEVLPRAAIVLTLHEFLAICHQEGRMVTRPDGHLCRASGFVACARCFPEKDSSDFFLRQTYIRHFFGRVDCFIAPSRFLAGRYVAWGVPEARIRVIENVPMQGSAPRGAPIGEPGPSVASIRERASARGLRVGFFGQISQLKGAGILLDAASLLRSEDDISFSIHGELRTQTAEFQEQFRARVARLSRNVTFHGPYPNEEVGSLMAEIDVVVVPSTWWENSPVVIQEAGRAGRPVVCSNIGGMAEKVIDGETGFHFPVGNAKALANLLKQLARDPERLGRVTQATAARRHEDALSQHIGLYRDLVAAKAARPVGGA